MFYRPSGMRRTCAVLIAGVIAACAPTGAVQHPERISHVHNGEATLRVFVEGSGPAIVLLPGQGRGPRDLDALAKDLVWSGYRVVRPEPRGFGEGVGPVEGLALRDNARDVASAIEKVAAGGKFPPKPDVMALLRKVQDTTLPLEERAEAARTVLYGPKSTISATDMRLDEVSAATIEAQSLAHTVPLEAWWDGGNVPMLVLQGLYDVIAPPENGRSLQRDHPERGTLVACEDLGHSLARERPDLVVHAIVRWTTTLK